MACSIASLASETAVGRETHARDDGRTRSSVASHRLPRGVRGGGRLGGAFAAPAAPIQAPGALAAQPGLLALNGVFLRLIAPGAAIGVAIAAESHGWGLLPALGIPAWAQALAAVVLLDLAVYFQHVLFHAVPALWRLHRLHHADTDFDVTTGTRFHPIEIVLSMAIKCAVVAAIGAPAIAVLAFEVLLNATAMFNHANGRLPGSIDRWLRWFVVTPDMHRVHHSTVVQETNSNFGFNVP